MRKLFKKTIIWSIVATFTLVMSMVFWIAAAGCERPNDTYYYCKRGNEHYIELKTSDDVLPKNIRLVVAGFGETKFLPMTCVEINDDIMIFKIENYNSMYSIRGISTNSYSGVNSKIKEFSEEKERSRLEEKNENNSIAGTLFTISIISFVLTIIGRQINREDERKERELKKKKKEVEMQQMIAKERAEQLPKFAVCEYCGAENDLNEKKCEACGAPLKNVRK